MHLKELKEQVDLYVKNGHGDDRVLITLSDPCIGARSSVDVTGIFPGFDWESGQVRIEAGEKIVKYKTNRDSPVKPCTDERVSGNRKVTIFYCARCKHTIRRSDKYCCHCGQKIGEAGDIK